ncbi:MAG: hypothetical protein AAF577_10000 [Pseudomonadota bacterium]
MTVGHDDWDGAEGGMSDAGVDAALDTALGNLAAAEAAMRPAVGSALMARVLADAAMVSGATGREESTAPALPGDPALPVSRPAARSTSRPVSPSRDRRGDKTRPRRTAVGGGSVIRANPVLPMMVAMVASLAIGVFVGASGVAPMPSQGALAMLNDETVVADALLFADEEPF